MPWNVADEVSGGAARTTVKLDDSKKHAVASAVTLRIGWQGIKIPHRNRHREGGIPRNAKIFPSAVAVR